MSRTRHHRTKPEHYRFWKHERAAIRKNHYRRHRHLWRQLMRRGAWALIEVQKKTQGWLTW